MTVLPVRTIGTVTLAEGAVLRRNVEVPVVPPVSDNEPGVAVIEGVDPWIVNGTVIAALSTGVGTPLSNAVAVAV